MNVGVRSLMAVINRSFKVCVVLLGLVFSTQASSGIGLQVAWADFITEVQPVLDRGTKLSSVLGEALKTFKENSVSKAATNIFIELLDALLTKVSQSSSLDAADALQEYRKYLFDEMLPASRLLRQKLALEVFKEQKKWNVVMTETGLVGSVDADVFMHFVTSLPQFMSNLTCEGKYLIAPEKLAEFKKHGIALSKKFKTSVAVVLAKGAANYTARGFKVAAPQVRKAVVSVKNHTVDGAKMMRQKIKKMDAGTVRKVVMTTGAVSATALLLGSCYFVNNHRHIIRNFVESMGGPEKVKKQIVLTYLHPASGAKRIKGMLLGGLERKVQEWWYDDSAYRTNRLTELRQKIAAAQKSSTSPSLSSSVASAQDPLTDYLLSLSATPGSIPQECALEVQTEMRRSLNRERYRREQVARQAELQKGLLKKSRAAEKASKAAFGEYKEHLSPAFRKHPLRWISHAWNGLPTGTVHVGTPVLMGTLVPSSSSAPAGGASTPNPSAPSAPAVSKSLLRRTLSFVGF
jgi:hypothetical protein